VAAQGTVRAALAFLLLYCCGVCVAQTVVPLEVEDDNYLATLRIGEVHLKAVLDTSGRYAIAISPEALEKLQVRFSGGTVERSGMGGEKFRGRSFVIPSMELGGTIFLSVDGVERRHLGSESGELPYEAVIGGAFLEHYTVVVDYPQRRFELEPPARGPAVCGPSTAPMLPTQNGTMFTTVRTDSGVMNLGWSTGSTYSVVQKTVTYLRGLTLKDGFYATKRFVLERVDAGPAEMVSIDVPGIPDLDGLIGFDFFERYRVCFDYARGTVNVQVPDLKERAVPARH
jgi:hypothetical protein